MRRGGFTLLEMMVATLIMGIAVAGLLSGISGATRAKMDELLMDRTLARGAVVRGPIAPALLGGGEGGWIARVTPFENPPVMAAGMQGIDRIELEIWWTAGGQRRAFRLDGYRTYTLLPRDVGQ